MRILRIRRGFQADHSSSSYVFYAADRPVSPKGQQAAHRYSSRAEVDEYTARYHYWGDYELRSEAYKGLLSQHYDVMVSESYDLWTFMIAVPKTPQLQALLQPFHDIADEFVRVEVLDFGRRLVIQLNCDLDAGGPWVHEEDTFEYFADLLVKIRHEILAGDVSFVQAVAAFYTAGEEDEGDSDEIVDMTSSTKAELQAECGTRGIPYRKSWTKDQLQDALGTGQRRFTMPRKLSPAATEIVDSLDTRS